MFFGRIKAINVKNLGLIFALAIMSQLQATELLGSIMSFSNSGALSSVTSNTNSETEFPEEECQTENALGLATPTAGSQGRTLSSSWLTVEESKVLLLTFRKSGKDLNVDESFSRPTPLVDDLLEVPIVVSCAQLTFNS